MEVYNYSSISTSTCDSCYKYSKTNQKFYEIKKCLHHLCETCAEDSLRLKKCKKRLCNNLFENL
jgi:hypothetical protein